MQLAEKLLLRSYHALDYDWTPLSRNPCWLSNVAHRFRCYVKRNRFRSDFISWLTIDKDYCQLLIRLNGGSDKSIVDDFVASGYCKCESGLCATIHWGLSRVPMICSSFIARLRRLMGLIDDSSLSWSRVVGSLSMERYGCFDTTVLLWAVVRSSCIFFENSWGDQKK